MHRSTLILVIALVPLLAGCIYSREMAQIRKDIERTYPHAEFDRQVVVSVGPHLFRTLGWIAGQVNDEDAQLASDMLYEIHRVKVGVYQTEYLPDLENMDIPELQAFQRKGWELAVKSLDDDEAVWILYREDRDLVHDMYVVVLNDDELVMARLEGHLNHILEHALDDHRHLVDFAVAEGHDR